MTYYEILGIGEKASQEQIKSAYRSSVKKYHPDVNNAPNASAFFRMIQEAYETLHDQQKRNVYDSQIRFQSTSKQKSNQCCSAEQTDQDSSRTHSWGSAAHTEKVHFVQEVFHQAGKRNRRYKQRIKASFQSYGLIHKVVSVLCRILVIILMPIIIALFFLYHLLASIAAFASWLLMITGSMGFFALVVFLIINKSIFQSGEFWLLIAISIGAACAGYYLPAFFSWTQDKAEDAVDNIKDYAFQSKLFWH